MNINCEIPLFINNNIKCYNCGLIKSTNCYIKNDNSLLKYKIYCSTCNKEVYSYNIKNDLHIIHKFIKNI